MTAIRPSFVNMRPQSSFDEGKNEEREGGREEGRQTPASAFLNQERLTFIASQMAIEASRKKARHTRLLLLLYRTADRHEEAATTEQRRR